MKSIGMLLLVVAILLVALWFAGERGLVKFPYPPIWPSLRENVTITVVRSQDQCVVIDAPSRLFTKAGRRVTWRILALTDKCADHDVIVQFEGDDPTGGHDKKTKATEGSEITAPITATGEKNKLYVYKILLASDPIVMGRGTLAYCPYWPCNGIRAYPDDATMTTEPEGSVTPTTPLAPGMGSRPSISLMARR